MAVVFVADCAKKHNVNFIHFIIGKVFSSDLHGFIQIFLRQRGIITLVTSQRRYIVALFITAVMLTAMAKYFFKLAKMFV